MKLDKKLDAMATAFAGQAVVGHEIDVARQKCYELRGMRKSKSRDEQLASAEKTLETLVLGYYTPLLVGKWIRETTNASIFMYQYVSRIFYEHGRLVTVGPVITEKGFSPDTTPLCRNYDVGSQDYLPVMVETTKAVFEKLAKIKMDELASVSEELGTVTGTSVSCKRAVKKVIEEYNG